MSVSKTDQNPTLSMSGTGNFSSTVRILRKRHNVFIRFVYPGQRLSECHFDDPIKRVGSWLIHFQMQSFCSVLWKMSNRARAGEQEMRAEGGALIGGNEVSMI